MGGGWSWSSRTGETPLLTHSSADTGSIADALTRLSDEQVRRRVNLDEMIRLEIYPGWDDAEDMEHLFGKLRRLRETALRAEGSGCCQQHPLKGRGGAARCGSGFWGRG